MSEADTDAPTVSEEVALDVPEGEDVDDGEAALVSEALAAAEDDSDLAAVRETVSELLA